MRVILDMIIKLFLRIIVPFALKGSALRGVDGIASPRLTVKQPKLYLIKKL